MRLTGGFGEFGWLGAALVLALVLGATPARGEHSSGVVSHDSQIWVAYLNQTRISDRFSLWADLHLAPGAFAVARPGFTVHFADVMSATAGYAFVGLRLGPDNPKLGRPEHRPWAQLVLQNRFDGWSFLHRIRYEARFRHNVENGELTSGYSLSHRLRFLANFRIDFPSLQIADVVVPYVVLADEVLLNFGPDVVYNRFDQNRVQLALGFAFGAVSLQVGYMNRLIQQASSADLTMTHSVLLWVLHNVDLR